MDVTRFANVSSRAKVFDTKLGRARIRNWSSHSVVGRNAETRASPVIGSFPGVSPQVPRRFFIPDDDLFPGFVRHRALAPLPP